MNKVRLECSHEALHKLGLATETKRGTMIKVPKDALIALLIDHGRLIKYIGRDNLEGIL